MLEVNLNPCERRSLTNYITQVGVDLAKNVIQVPAVDASGRVFTNRALTKKLGIFIHIDFSSGLKFIHINQRLTKFSA